MKDMTVTQLREKSRNYDRINNEGGEGYNPYRDELERREMATEAARPKTSADRKREIYHQLEIKDCSIARECGTYNQAEIDALRAELAETEAAEVAEFAAEWTPEETQTRRSAWNSFVNAELAGGPMTPDKYRKLHAWKEEHGWGLDEVKKAVKLHNLGVAK